MITQNEISSLNLSPTKKDFVQIWNELIEVASKITERWDPTSTNESDPGIVLLKVLAGIADKLNYNIDKNILEAFMPTAAQMESMRKLCELVGYDIKYYQSAETKVRISYTGNTTDTSSENEERLPEPGGLQLPRFTTITNADKDITFVTTNAVPVLITNDVPWVEVPCIEGQISQCESVNEANLITLSQLDDNNRYYLPEIQIAENGIFVYNATTILKNGETSLADGTPWLQVANLNTQPSNTRVFKFGYDSLEGRPYLVFPDDVSSLIGDGLFIYFIRTSGQSGNISPRTLEVLEIPTGDDWDKYSAEQFEVINVDATTNGANIESISAAYNNFKKTVGTFDTLVTCRDYMNKIYSLMDANNYPYVSNILVTDIRNDINNAITLCSCNEFGILYKETPLLSTDRSLSVFRRTEYNEESDTYKLFVDQTNAEIPLIDHFDLLLYPFKTFTQVSSGTTDLVKPYNKSFTYTEQMNNDIEASLAELKTCAHRLTAPAEGSVVAINNYLRLNAFIATSTKVSEVEAKSILQNVKVALVNEFNLRNLDFGEEIPFDSILSVIENADSRIKVVSLQEPTVLTTYSVKEYEDGNITSKEYGIVSAEDLAKEENMISGVKYGTGSAEDPEYNHIKAKEIYNKLVLRNILAGRASLFNYDDAFVANNSEKPYTITAKVDIDKLTDTDLKNKLTQILENAGDDPTEEVLTTQEGLIKGPNNGVLTLHVSEQTETTDIVKEIYETYTPSFIFAVNPDGSVKRDENDQPVIDEDKKDSIINDITHIEAVCEINNENGLFKNIKLAKNEVIKFRAPNLITTKTFPAYVYYHFEHEDADSSSGNNESTSSKYGSFARAMTLADFINQDDIGVKKFFEKLWEKAGIDFSNEDYTFVAEPEDPTNPKIPSGGKLANIFNTAFAVEADTQLQVKKKDPITKLPIEPIQYEDYHTKTFIKKSDLENVLSEHFSNSANKTPIKFRYYPLTYHTSSTWSSCIKELDVSLPTYDLWQLSSTSSHPRGKLVMESGKKLIGLNGDSLTYGNVSELVHICTYLGTDPDYASIEENSEIELGPTDKLYIHYTPSSTNEDGETVNAEPVSIVYEGGIRTDSNGNKTDPIIIKPSGFTLMPSVDVNRQGTSWKKTDVDFNGKKINLLALAPNEQIEMRSISRVVLDKPARFYRNFEATELDGNVNAIETYELKDGEYIFYTDQNTQEAAYYGSGSVITLDKGAYIPKATEPVEISQILEQGLHIIPWSNVVLLGTNRKVTITEYQYVTLVEGDTLNTLTIDATDSDSKDKGDYKNGGYTLSNTRWRKCDTKNLVTYTTAGAETSTNLPKIALNSESSPSTSWEVCSFLELSTSPGYSQQLRAVEAGSETETSLGPTTASITNKINVFTKTDKGAEELAATITPKKTSISGGSEKFEPVSIKLNTFAQVASGNLEVNREEATNKTNIQLKIFKEEAPSKIELESLDDTITPISNKISVSVEPSAVTVNNYWSKIDIPSELWRNSLGSTAKKPNALSLNFMIPENNNSGMFGIFSIYLDVPEDKLGNQNLPIENSRVFIEIPKEFDSYTDVVSIFNYEESVKENDTDTTPTTYYWWSKGVASPNKLYLRAGLNCIKIVKSCKLLIKAEENADGSILYDNMRLVNGVSTNGVNLELLKFKNTKNEPVTDADLAKAVLDGIKALDKNHEFYYNVPIENSLAIEFDKNINSFDSPYTLYDINNVNNSFVISKLDVKYLEEGLKIAKSSRSSRYQGADNL